MVKLQALARGSHRRLLIPVLVAVAVGLQKCFVGRQHLADHVILPSRSAVVLPARRAGATEQLASPFQALGSCEVLAGSTGQPVRITSLWEPGERAVVIFGRSFG
mmetsp:Transcript_1589/g.4095  ORF Transcript_1589/g.4095 Transcript_1589/m.4095 type:complete len:105 (+) Transcript_1589:62-376(+)